MGIAEKMTLAITVAWVVWYWGERCQRSPVRPVRVADERGVQEPWASELFARWWDADET